MAYREPWPSPVREWADPPWWLRGSCVTAWFETPRPIATKLLSPDLLPDDHGPGVMTRLRFYEVHYGAFTETGRDEGGVGNFREAVVAFAVHSGDIAGEVSSFMWTDDMTYLLWGREVFGWPLIQATIREDGDLLTVGHIESTLSASVEIPQGTLRLEATAQEDDGRPGVGFSTWLTPRRTVRWANGAGVEVQRDLLLVYPRVVSAGRHLRCEGEIRLELSESHPLHVLKSPVAHSIDAAVDFELVVGSNVEVRQ